MSEVTLPTVEVCNSWQELIDAIKDEALKYDNVILKSCDMPQKLRLGWVLCVPKEGYWEAKFYGIPVFKMREAPQEVLDYMKANNKDGNGLKPEVLTNYIENYIWDVS